MSPSSDMHEFNIHVAITDRAMAQSNREELVELAAEFGREAMVSYLDKGEKKDQRPCPPAMKLASYRWAVAVLGGGQEAVFRKRTGLYSLAPYEELVNLLLHHLPEESEQYLGARTGHSSRWSEGPRLLLQRVHRMFWPETSTTEHPRNWNPTMLDLAQRRLTEVDFPYGQVV